MTFSRNIQNTLEYTVSALFFMFHASVVTLSSVKLYTENNERLFLLLTGSVTYNFCHFQ